MGHEDAHLGLVLYFVGSLLELSDLSDDVGDLQEEVRESSICMPGTPSGRAGLWASWQLASCPLRAICASCPKGDPAGNRKLTIRIFEKLTRPSSV